MNHSPTMPSGIQATTKPMPSVSTMNSPQSATALVEGHRSVLVLFSVGGVADQEGRLVLLGHVEPEDDP